MPRPFDEIYAIALKRKGEHAVAERLSSPKAPAELAAISDDRWLSCASQIVFSAGFNWGLVEKKWPRFEEVFEGFAPATLAMKSDEDLDAYLKEDGIIRNAMRIRSIRGNAAFFQELAAEHGSAARAFAEWPAKDYVDLLEMLKKRGSRLGGTTGPYFLRRMGVDGFIVTKDVAAALAREGVADKPPSSRKAMRAAQEAFNAWSAQSGRPLTQISQILAMSVGE